MVVVVSPRVDGARSYWCSWRFGGDWEDLFFFLFSLVRWGVVVELRRRVVLVLVGGQRQGSRRADGHFHLSARER